MSKKRKSRKQLQAADVFSTKSKVADFFIKPEQQLSVEFLCRKHATQSYVQQHASFVSSWGKTYYYDLLGGRCWRNAVLRERAGVWVDGAKLMRFLLYALDVEYPKLLPGEKSIPTMSSFLSELAIRKGPKKDVSDKKPVRKAPKVEPVKQESQEKKERIYREIHELMGREKPDIGPDLATFVAKWGEYHKYMGSYWGSSRVLRWALSGRAEKFMRYVNSEAGPVAKAASEAVMVIYRKPWPHNAVCGPMFYAMWGWLQLELRKPGERRPKSMREQQLYLEQEYAKEGKRVTQWEVIGASIFVVKSEKIEE